MKGTAFIRYRLYPDPSAHLVHDFLGDGQSDAGTGILVAVMEPLKDYEYPFKVPGIDTDAVVRNGEVPVRSVLLGLNGYLRRHVFTVVFQTIGNEILEKLS